VEKQPLELLLLVEEEVVLLVKVQTPLDQMAGIQA
jgi:hypothetical protein